MEGVVKFEVDVEGFVASNDPPTDASYQRNVPLEDDEAERDTVPVPHLDPFVIVGTAGTVLMIALTAVRDVLVQVPLSNST
jgi:hypothetical protein